MYVKSGADGNCDLLQVLKKKTTPQKAKVRDGEKAAWTSSNASGPSSSLLLECVAAHEL